MSNYVLINDVHLSDRAPASCTDTYLDDLFDLLREAAIMAGQRGARIILAGDVFHHKAPSRTSHGTVMRLIRWAENFPGDIYAVVGNHDLSHDRHDSIYESQPLGVVFASGAIKQLNGWIDGGGGAYVYGVPWQMSWDKAHVEDALADYRYEGSAAASNDAPCLVVTHAPLYPPGRELRFEYYPAADFAAAMDNHGTVHYGHVHEPHGIYTVNGVTFSNPGALSRGSLHEHNLTRMPTVAVWDSNVGDIEHVRLRAKPAEDVFRLTEAAETKAAGINLNRFLDSVQKTRLDITTLDGVMTHIRETTDDAALVAVVEKLLQEQGS